MLSKQEKQTLNTEFWTTFRIYMSKNQSEGTHNSNWINYKTGIKHIRIRTSVDAKNIAFSIELEHNDSDIRELIFEQWQELRTLLSSEFGTELQWYARAFNGQGREISCVVNERSDWNYIKKSDWQNIFQFLEHNLLAFDRFWTDWKSTFEALA